MTHVATLAPIKTKQAITNGHTPTMPYENFFRLSVEQYHDMIEAGILTEDDSVELLEGWLIQKMAKNPRHRKVKRLLWDALQTICANRWYVEDQEPITLRDSEPEPDLIIAQGSRADYDEHHPFPEQLVIVIEVADATLYHDRNLKKRMYAHAGIRMYWIANLVDNQIEVYTEPFVTGGVGNYRQQKNYTIDELLPVVIDDQELGQLAVRDLLQ